jgi:hypothetical protein
LWNVLEPSGWTTTTIWIRKKYRTQTFVLTRITVWFIQTRQCGQCQLYTVYVNTSNITIFYRHSCNISTNYRTIWNVICDLLQYVSTYHKSQPHNFECNVWSTVYYVTHSIGRYNKFKKWKICEKWITIIAPPKKLMMSCDSLKSIIKVSSNQYKPDLQPPPNFKHYLRL